MKRFLNFRIELFPGCTSVQCRGLQKPVRRPLLEPEQPVEQHVRNIIRVRVPVAAPRNSSTSLTCCISLFFFWSALFTFATRQCTDCHPSSKTRFQRTSSKLSLFLDALRASIRFRYIQLQHNLHSRPRVPRESLFSAPIFHVS